MFKRIISFGVLLAIAFSFCACGGTSIWYDEIYQGSGSINAENWVYAIYQAENPSDQDFKSAMYGTISEITSMLVSKGYSEALVQREGSNRIRVSVPDINDPAEILKIIGGSAEIKFVLDSGETVITGKEIVNARAQYSQENGEYVVALSFNSEGAKKFANATANNIGSTMHIITIINGEETTISSPKINMAITGGQAVITGMGTGNSGLNRAEELAGRIMTGKLPLRLSLVKTDIIAGEVKEFTPKLIKSETELDLFNLFRFTIDGGSAISQNFDESYFEKYPQLFAAECDTVNRDIIKWSLHENMKKNRELIDKIQEIEKRLGLEIHHEW